MPEAHQIMYLMITHDTSIKKYGQWKQCYDLKPHDIFSSLVFQFLSHGRHLYFIKPSDHNLCRDILANIVNNTYTTCY